MTNALPTALLGGGVTTSGVSVHVTPAGNPVQPRLTGALKLRCENTRQVVPALPPGEAARSLGKHSTTKSGGGVTFTDTAVARVRPPGPVPTTAKLDTPCGGAGDVLRVRVLGARPPGGVVTSGGSNTQEAPAGSAWQEKVTGALKPLTDVM